MHRRTAKAQTSLCICAVWSEPYLLVISMFKSEKSTNIKYKLELDCMDTQTGLSLSCSKKATFLHNATQMIKCHLNSLGSARYLSVNIEINCVSSAVYKKIWVT